ncbi:MAG: tetratricopeptide repeat protein, partial [Hyphomicrobium sp.]
EWNRSNFRSARELLQQAVALDPANARTHRELAWIAAASWVFYMDAAPMPPETFLALAVKAVQLDPADARARMVAASAYFWTNQLDRFEQEVNQALALAPHEPEIMATLGFMLAVSGQWTRGLAMVDKANALNPEAAVAWYHSARYTDCYLRGDYQCALVFRQQNPDHSTIYAYIEEIQVFGQLGRRQDAQESWRKLRAEKPDWSASDFETWHRRWNKPEADIAKFMDGVRKSGVLGAGAAL